MARARRRGGGGARAPAAAAPHTGGLVRRRVSVRVVVIVTRRVSVSGCVLFEWDCCMASVRWHARRETFKDIVLSAKFYTNFLITRLV